MAKSKQLVYLMQTDTDDKKCDIGEVRISKVGWMIYCLTFANYTCYTEYRKLKILSLLKTLKEGIMTASGLKIHRT